MLDCACLAVSKVAKIVISQLGSQQSNQDLGPSPHAMNPKQGSKNANLRIHAAAWLREELTATAKAEYRQLTYTRTGGGGLHMQQTVQRCPESGRLQKQQLGEEGGHARLGHARKCWGKEPDVSRGSMMCEAILHKRQWRWLSLCNGQCKPQECSWCCCWSPYKVASPLLALPGGCKAAGTCQMALIGWQDPAREGI